MKNAKIKLLYAFVILIVAATLAVTGTFAWFVINDQPLSVSGMEMSLSGEGDEWPFEFSLSAAAGEDPGTYTFTKNVRLTELFTSSTIDTVELNPISTYDGSKWYQAHYDDEGNVDGLTEVAFSDVSTDISKGADSNNFRTDGTNSVVYFDVWVRTGDKNHTHSLKLSNPLSTDNIMEEEEEYGTFVVGVPTWSAILNEWTTTTASENTCRCIRFGFLAYHKNDDGTESPETFVIYEPNCNTRSDFDGSTSDTSYIASGAAVAVSSHTSADGIIQTSSLVSEDVYGVYPNTIYQYTSQWKSTSVLDPQMTKHSSNVDIGKFVDNEDTPAAYQGIDTIGITDLSCNEDGTPIIKRLRIFIWIEGQDVDCWNTTALGSIYSHLEFRGDLVDE